MSVRIRPLEVITINVEREPSLRPRNGRNRILFTRRHFLVVFGITALYAMLSMNILYVGITGPSAYKEANKKLVSLFHMTDHDILLLYKMSAAVFASQVLSSMCIFAGISVLNPYWILPFLISFPAVVIYYLFLSLVALICYVGKDSEIFSLMVGGGAIANSLVFGMLYMIIYDAYAVIYAIYYRNRRIVTS